MLKVKNCNILALSLAFMAGVPAVHADLLDDGRQAFMEYDFERAAELYDKYAQSLKRKPDADGQALLDTYRKQLEIAENSLENVQQIEVIDRIDVPAQDFLSAVKLPSIGGKLLSPDKSPLKNERNTSDYVFTNESGDFAMWSETDSEGVSHLMESHRLTDGSWEQPWSSGVDLNDGGDVRNPFMMSDGVTVYFSGNGDTSMGGYDIFVVSKDPVSGEYRQPVGVGYPFNSPGNEYLLAIDEAHGIGWWVTDRNSTDGQLSVYIYRTNDVRKNYVADEVEDIVALARLDDISLAQNPDVDYAGIIAEIDKRSIADKKKTSFDFFFPMPGGKIYHSVDDFRSPKAKRSFAQYMSAMKEHEAELKSLRSLRMKYHAADRKSGVAASLANLIKDLEKQTEEQRTRLDKMRNAVITAELKQL